MLKNINKKYVALISIAAITVTLSSYQSIRINRMETELQTINSKYIAVVKDNENKQQQIDKVNKEIEEKVNIINSLTKDREDLSDLLKKSKDQLEEILRKVSYNPNNLTEPSGTTLSHMQRALKGTPMEDLASAFVNAEDEYGVNAFFLAGLVANESGWNTSSRATTQNNLTGYAVYHNYSRGASFDSKDESIMRTASLLKSEYLDKSGEHYNGESIWQVNIKYSQKKNEPNTEWGETINNIALQLVNKANDF